MSAPNTPPPTPTNFIPAPISEKQSLSKTNQKGIAEKEQSDARNDARNRERIALAFLITSIVSVILISVVVVISATDKQTASQRVMDSTLPLYGTWVGTILAFYFSRNAFEAASSATTRNATLFQQVTSGLVSVSPPPDNLLAKISLKSLRNDLIFSQNDVKKPLQEVLKDLEDKNRYRTIVVNPDKSYADLVYQINAKAYLTPPGDGQQPSSVPTLEDYLNWRNKQGERAKPKVVFLPENATLADADAKLKEITGCSDVIVTTDGQPTSPVVVYVTDNDINEYKR